MSPSGSGGSSTLADLIVKLSLQGQEQLQHGLDDLKQHTEQTAQALGQLGARLDASMQQAAQQTARTDSAIDGLRQSTEQGSRAMSAALGTVGAAVTQLTALLTAGMTTAAAGTGKATSAAGALTQAVAGGAASMQGALGAAAGAAGGLGTKVGGAGQMVAAGLGKATAAVEALHQTIARDGQDMQMALGAVVLAVNKLGVQMNATASTSKARLGEVKKPIGELGDSFAHLGGTINLALAAGQASIAGFVRQGLSLSATGQIMQFQLERLSLAISGLFRPEIQKVTEWIGRLTNYLNNLSDRQRENVARWIQGGAAALFVAGVFPKVVMGVKALAGGFRFLQAAITGTLSSTGIGALLPLLGLALEGMTALLVGTEGGRNALSRIFDELSKLGDFFKEMADEIQLDKIFEECAQSLGEMLSASLQIFKVFLKISGAAEQLKLTLKTVAVLMELWAKYSIEAQIARAMAQMNDQTEKHVKKKTDRTTDVRRSSGFSSVESVYERLATISVGQRDYQKDTAESLERIERDLGPLGWALRNYKPPVARGA